ncbi:RNA 2'-phosphotransferase [Actinorugispora endophytica]|uniref:Probable RNA 2'-phosphotransferase n=1 Tax=Actinorugispora endophytica TaxID=1605990 RepID=A0A4R6UVV9_9ACTN|nr:RNA 2'-phosphotransferase [Actinorugispora endophytica]TDQ49605.1 putative RNA 2'-phosphotransferase [Actinorugispora endophytica]
MSERELVRRSRFLARVLRHEPERAGTVLDPEGWAEVDALLSGCRAAGRRITRAQLEEVVRRDDEKRFAFSPDGRRIRAQQGHTVEVDLAPPPSVPPDVLHHGTVGRFLPAIDARGLRPMSRHHVRLSPDAVTARRVGARRGAPVVLTVAAGPMHANGYVFRLSGNGVWLVAGVPARYLGYFPDRAG